MAERLLVLSSVHSLAKSADNHTVTLDQTFVRTELLLGNDGLDKLRRSHVLVIGLGGVGGYAVEMLCRSGVGELTIVDADAVQQSNINRQIIANQSTVGIPKAELWEQRLKSINPEVILHTKEIFIKDEITDELLSASNYDFVIDAIDTLSPKVNLIKSLRLGNMPFVSAMGAGAKLDPTMIRIGRMDKAKNCPLARFIRKRLRHLDIPLDFTVVYSEELPDDNAVIMTEGEQNKKSTTGTIAYMPAVTGCYCAYAAIRHITNQTEPPL